MKRFLVVLTLASAVLLAACGSNAPHDPYADPGTPPPPPVVDPTVNPAMRLSAPNAAGIITLNVAGMTSDADRSPGTGDFTVVEDGVVKGITVERISGSSRAAADIAFIVDTTGSMNYAIDSVKDSIIGFVDFLDGSGLDVRVGAVTFGDAYDTRAVGSMSTGTSLRGDEPPAFDQDERPTFPLTSNIEAFKAFIGEQDAQGGGYFPENSLGATVFAAENLSWRPDAQCVLIVITDNSSWNHENPGDPITPHWYPPSPEQALETLNTNNCVAHVIGPVIDTSWWPLPDNEYDMAGLTGVPGTGGVFMELESSGFSLTELPISSVLSSGYLVRYRGTINNEEHEVRLVVRSGDIRGETTSTATY